MVNYQRLPSGQLDNVFAALAHSKRRDMVHALSFRPATVTQLAKEYDLSLPAIHKHIRSLEKAELIHRKKVGRTNFVALNHASLRLIQTWSGQYRTEWGSDEETLENYIAGLHD
jgi:DNA-binding transcriptional ArsR family regulator